LVFAQETGTDKKANVGIVYQLGLNFMKSGTNEIEKDGVGAQNAFGLNVNFNFNENIGFATGLEFDFESYKISFTGAKDSYYYYRDKEIIQEEDLKDPNTDNVFQITGRKYKSIYATIPTMLIFRTNAIGDFRYYGKFGARTSFLVKSTKTDQGYIFGGGANGTNIDAIESGSTIYPTATSEMSGMKTPYGNDVSFIRCALGIAGGAQWNFTGNTLLFAELGFYYGLTPINIEGSAKNRTLFHRNAGAPGTSDSFGLKTNQTQFCLKIGILF
jgi:hypothetical protein